MNFKESKEILEKIQNAKNILLAFHQSPDPDSITSNLLMSNFLRSQNISHSIICSDIVPKRFKDTYDMRLVKDNVDFEKYDFSKFDLFIALDVNQPRRFGLTDKILPEVINIDHHYTKNEFDGLKINDSTYCSTAEIMFYILEDFGYKISQEEANLALIGIITDTESFSYGSSSRVFVTVSKLLELGGDYSKVDELIYRNNDIDQIKYWAEALKRIKVDKKYRFAYTSLDIKTVKKYPNVLQGTRTVADKFMRTIKDTNFGMIMTETEEGYLKISVRSRSSTFGIPDLLTALNGGGHFGGGGGRIDLPYKEAVKEALKIARKFARDKMKENDK